MRGHTCTIVPSTGAAAESREIVPRDGSPDVM